LTESLREKTISGLLWSFVDSFVGQGITFFIGIILARLLSPREFGLLGMTAIFIAISQSIVDSGFGSALIQKKKCTENDYSTVFYYNLAIGFLVFGLLYFFAPTISIYFHEPILKQIIRVLGFLVVINSVSMIQLTILTKRVNFKLLTRISIISSVISGVVAITMALLNFGVWSLVAAQITKQAFNTIFLWLWNKWKPLMKFSMDSFMELFGFGSKMLISGLIATIYENIYYLVIGKYFSAIELGYFTRANQFKNLPSKNITSIIRRVSFPILSSIQDDNQRLLNNYRKLIKSTVFITFPLMLGMVAVAKAMIIVLVGEKWLPSVIYLQMLCVGGMLYPLHSINLNMLQVKGRSDLFLRLEIIKRVLAIPTIIIGVIYGIKIMIIGMIINSIFAYYLNSYWSGKLIGYPISQQFIDIIPALVLSIVICSIVYSICIFINLSPGVMFFSQTASGIILFILINELVNLKDYLFLKNIVFEKINLIRNH
jgi:teichuronic acid exporter